MFNVDNFSQFDVKWIIFSQFLPGAFSQHCWKKPCRIKALIRQSCGVPGQEKYLIVSILDLYLPLYFELTNMLDPVFLNKKIFMFFLYISPSKIMQTFLVKGPVFLNKIGRG